MRSVVQVHVGPPPKSLALAFLVLGSVQVGPPNTRGGNLLYAVTQSSHQVGHGYTGTPVVAEPDRLGPPPLDRPVPTRCRHGSRKRTHGLGRIGPRGGWGPSPGNLKECVTHRPRRRPGRNGKTASRRRRAMSIAVSQFCRRPTGSPPGDQHRARGVTPHRLRQPALPRRPTT